MVVPGAFGKSRAAAEDSMKQDPAFFDGVEPELVYIAKRLRDAIEIESLFDAAGVDYGVEADTYTGGIVFRSERVGAFFYVLPAEVENARKVLKTHGFQPSVQ
jgi:hypothetical protein